MFLIRLNTVVADMFNNLAILLIPQPSFSKLTIALLVKGCHAALI